jgi:hypothetical protein
MAMQELPGGTGRHYNVVLPDDLYVELERLAVYQGTSVLYLMKQFIKLGLLAAAADNQPGTVLVLRENGREREIHLTGGM